MTSMLKIIVFSCLGGYLLSFIVKNLLYKLGLLDQPDGENGRKIHKKSVVRGGGIAIFVASMIGFLIVTGFDKAYLAFYLGASLMFLVGLLDDVFNIRARYKLIGQVVVIAIAMSLGLTIEFLNGPGDGTMAIGWFSLPLTFLWLLGITNAINLIDGLDGLAGGIAGISASVLGIVSLTVGRAEVAALAFILAFSLFGFLPHNFSNKKKMFMGDSGSQYLGFSLGSLSILGVTKVAAVFTMLTPMMILAIPILDTVFAIIRRAVKGNSIFVADRGHLHHRLLDLGFSQRQVVMFIYYVTILFGVVAIYTTRIAPKWAVVLFALASLIVGLFTFLLWRKSQKKIP